MEATRLRYLGVAAVLLVASAALGDGCYIPERAVRKIPEIPAQRALLSWKDGVETLVISSALDSESQKLGWIIPLPSVPQTIEKESPGGLRTLNFCIQPEITHDVSLQIKGAILAVFLGNLLLGTWLFKRTRFRDVVWLILLLFMFSSVILPAGRSTGVGMTKAANVRIEKSATVGSYGIRVLKSSQPDELNAWLAENGFASLPAAADKTIADYISQGWVFAAVKLVRTESGANAPHPIKMVFAAKEPVYPLRLTAIAGGSPHFEIFVIGDGTASCDLLEEEFCDRFSSVEHGAGEGFETKTSFAGATTRLGIGHPAVCPLMWDNCVLTKFSGTIDSHNMARDIRFDWNPFVACQQHFYTVSGAWDCAVIVFVLLVGGWAFISMLAWHKRILQPRGLRWYMAWVLLPAVSLFAVGTRVVWTSLPTLNASEVQISRGFRWHRHLPHLLRGDIESLIEKHPDILQGTDREIADHLLKALRDKMVKYAMETRTITGAELKVEDSPGNFTVEKRHDKVLVRIYDRVGRALIVEQPIPARGENSTKR